VAITADDGHRSVFTVMKPLIERERIPVTLFSYPSAISNASYAMTWEQLAALKATGLFSIESHSYWHPNFRKEKRRLSADTYRKFVELQMTNPGRCSYGGWIRQPTCWRGRLGSTMMS